MEISTEEHNNNLTFINNFRKVYQDLSEFEFVLSNDTLFYNLINIRFSNKFNTSYNFISYQLQKLEDILNDNKIPYVIYWPKIGRKSIKIDIDKISNIRKLNILLNV